AVWERDGGQCTFVNGEGRRCQERRFMTLEHRDPHALGGEASVENLCLLGRSHNVHAGRRLFGERRRARGRGRAHEAIATDTEPAKRLFASKRRSLFAKVRLPMTPLRGDCLFRGFGKGGQVTRGEVSLGPWCKVLHNADTCLESLSQ